MLNRAASGHIEKSNHGDSKHDREEHREYGSGEVG